MKSYWKNKKTLVTGGAGFIGSHVVELLVKNGAKVTVLDNFQNGSRDNLLAVKSDVEIVKKDCRDLGSITKHFKNKDAVFNIAARVGGIEYNRTHQATMLRDNLAIANSVIEAARTGGVERMLAVSSACVYPRECTVPTPESEGFLGEPEPTNGGYGWAKRVSELLARYYVEEFGMKIGIVRPYNCYGPRDHVDPATSHVIPALIKRVYDKENPIKVWGSGKQTRAFLYVTDMAEGMLLALEKNPKPIAINLGTDEEISIKDLVSKIIKLTNLNPRTEFDTSKPDGSIRRNSDNTNASKFIGFSAKVNFDEGLKRTIDWYQSTYGKRS